MINIIWLQAHFGRLKPRIVVSQHDFLANKQKIDQQILTGEHFEEDETFEKIVMKANRYRKRLESEGIDRVQPGVRAKSPVKETRKETVHSRRSRSCSRRSRSRSRSRTNRKRENSTSALRSQSGKQKNKGKRISSGYKDDLYDKSVKRRSGDKSPAQSKSKAKSRQQNEKEERRNRSSSDSHDGFPVKSTQTRKGRISQGNVANGTNEFVQKRSRDVDQSQSRAKPRKEKEMQRRKRSFSSRNDDIPAHSGQTTKNKRKDSSESETNSERDATPELVKRRSGDARPEAVSIQQKEKGRRRKRSSSDDEFPATSVLVKNALRCVSRSRDHRKKKKRSRSKKTLQSRSSSKSPSPLLKTATGLTSKSSRIRSFKEDERELNTQLDAERVLYYASPVKHPDYNQQWDRFWQRKNKELADRGENIDDHDLTPEWKEEWLRFYDNQFQTNMTTKRETLLKKWKLTIDDLKHDSPNKPFSPKSPEKVKAEQEVITLDDSEDDTVTKLPPPLPVSSLATTSMASTSLAGLEEVTVLGTLRLLSALNTGELGLLAGMTGELDRCTAEALQLESEKFGCSTARLVEQQYCHNLLERAQQTLQERSRAGRVPNNQTKAPSCNINKNKKTTTFTVCLCLLDVTVAAGVPDGAGQHRCLAAHLLPAGQ